MIDLANAALIAKMASDAVAAFDKIFRGYADFLKKKEPAALNIPPPDLSYVDLPKQNAFVAQSRQTGATSQKVTYEELCNKLNDSDRQYIKTLTQAMENYERQWTAAYEQRSMATGMDVGRLDSQLDYIVRQMADPLVKVLTFVERMGLCLDDHYLVARNLTELYIRDRRQ
jgi:hypothetical protein